MATTVEKIIKWGTIALASIAAATIIWNAAPQSLKDSLAKNAPDAAKSILNIPDKPPVERLFNNLSRGGGLNR
jgi:hypothetical protein